MWIQHLHAAPHVVLQVQPTGTATETAGRPLQLVQEVYIYHWYVYEGSMTSNRWCWDAVIQCWNGVPTSVVPANARISGSNA
jgi:hypothetical protein